EDPVGAELLHAPDVGAEVDLVRQDAMAAPMPRQEDQLGIPQPPDHELVGGITEWRGERDLLDRGEPFDLVQAGAADDADGACLHRARAYHTLAAMDIETLIAQGKYAEAAAEARRTGDLVRAQQLYERIWDWRGAAAVARERNDRPELLRLLLEGREFAEAA